MHGGDGTRRMFRAYWQESPCVGTSAPRSARARSSAGRSSLPRPMSPRPIDLAPSTATRDGNPFLGAITNGRYAYGHTFRESAAMTDEGETAELAFDGSERPDAD